MDTFRGPGVHTVEVLHKLSVDFHIISTSLVQDHAIRLWAPQDIQLLILH
jgi:hypothetical protein